MIRKLGRVAVLAATVLLTAPSVPAERVGRPLKVGAAKIVITPPAAELPAPFTSVADDIFVRAVVVESDGRRAVLIVVDVPTIAATVAADMTRRIAAQARVPEANVMLATSHTHNAVRVDPNTVGIFLPGSPRFVERVTKATLEAVRLATSAMVPARAGAGDGTANLIANRNQWSARLGRFIDGVDRTGSEPIDQRLRVIKFDDLAGKPIAFVLNYAIEPVIAMAWKDRISGDVPGATARYVENRIDGAVALFTVGAAGSPLYRVRDDGGPASIYGKADPARLIAAMATVLGEETLAVAETITTNNDVAIAGAKLPLICPGKLTTPVNLPNRCAHSADSKLPACDFKTVDAPPVTLDMGLLRIGDVALLHADANVTPALGRKLGRASPMTNTWFVARTFGPMRFVVDDAAYPLNTYEATASTAKPACGERGLIENALKMITQTR